MSIGMNGEMVALRGEVHSCECGGTRDVHNKSHLASCELMSALA
jgi:hypothetical protein